MSLFNNPIIERLRETLPKEKQEELAAIGKEMYETIDFENNTITDQIRVSHIHIRAGLMSGLNPDDLDEDEQAIMMEVEGEDWKLAYM